GGEKIAVVKSLALGLLKIIAQEYPTVVTSHIDISLSEAQEESFYEALCAELWDRQTGKVVSYRKGCRWIQLYDKIRTESSLEGSPLREGGVYLITGGLGKLGYTLATHLLRKAKANLILTGRTILDGTSKDESVRLKQGKLDQLRKLSEEVGGTVNYYSSEVSEIASLSQVVQSLITMHGKLHGVIHAAGVPDGAITHKALSALQVNDFDEQFAVKIKGVEALYEVLGD